MKETELQYLNCKMNIAYIDPIVHSKTASMYQYYNGLFDALQAHNSCTLMSGISNVEDLSADVFVFGLGYGFPCHIKGLKESTAKKIGFIFKPQNDLTKKMIFFKENKFDLLLTSLPDRSKYEKLSGVKCNRLCYATSSNVFYPGKQKKYHIGFSGALHQNKRYVDGAFPSVDVRGVIQKGLSMRSDIRCFLNGSDSVNPRIKSYKDYAQKIRESEMWFATPAAFGDITPRYFEVGMSGTTLICSGIRDEYKDIFRDGKTCILFKEDGSDFMEKFDYYRSHKTELDHISLNASKEFAEKHTWDARASEFIKEVECL